MMLPVFVLYVLGTVVECAMLWDAAHRESTPRRVGPFAATELRPAQWLSGAAFSVAIVLIGLIQLFGLSEIETSLSDPLGTLTFMAVCFFVLGAGVIADGLLPRVNEAAILSVVTLTALGTLASLLDGTMEVNWFILTFGLLIPSGVALLLVFWWRAFHPVIKAIIYLCYLFALLFIVFLSGADDYFRQLELSMADGFLFGVVSIFLLLHGMFAIRFFLIVSSLIFPRNRPLVALIMPRLFSDEQVNLLRALLVLLILSVVIIVNTWLHWFELPVLLSVLSVVSVQFLFQSQPFDSLLFFRRHPGAE